MMATWHCDFTLQSDLARLPGDYRERLDQFLPRFTSWHEFLEAWGSEGGNLVEVWHDPRGPKEIRVRVDVRSVDRHFLEEVVEFARAISRVAQSEDGRTFVDANELLVLVKGSPAWRFVQDPEAYLRRVELGGVEDA